MSEPISFKSKIDTWLLVVLLTAVAACVLGAAHVYSIAAEGEMGRLWFLAVLLIALCAVGAALPLWLLVGTRYTLTDTDLDVRSGPFRWTIPLDGIEQITATREMRSSPAMSLDRLKIRYGGGKRSTMISPEHKDVFLRSLESRRNSEADKPAARAAMGANPDRQT